MHAQNISDEYPWPHAYWYKWEKILKLVFIFKETTLVDIVYNVLQTPNLNGNFNLGYKENIKIQIGFS